MTGAAVRLPLILTELRLPTVKRLWAGLAEQSNKEGWPAERFLVAVMEHELAERETRRLERHRLESQLLPGKLLSSFDFTNVPTVSKAHVTALVEGDGWIEQGSNLLLFGPPGVGKSHLVCAIGNGLIDRGYRVHFTRTSDLSAANTTSGEVATGTLNGSGAQSLFVGGTLTVAGNQAPGVYGGTLSASVDYN